MNSEIVANICEIKEPLDWSEEKSKLMVEACREMAFFHQENSPEIAHLYKKYSFSPKQIKSEEDLSLIPPVGVSAMKSFLITSMEHDKAVLKLTSSGTRGQKTQIWFDQGSLNRVQRMLDVLWEQEGFYTPEQATNNIIFTYNPKQSDNLGIAFSCENELRFAKVNRVHYTISKDENGQWLYSKEALKKTCEEYEKEGLPVRIFGMPSFIYEFISSLNGQCFKFHPDSLIMTGGGWKAAEDKQITREDFRLLCARHFGISTKRIRDGFGMAEHSAPYFECDHHRFHIPAYNRIYARDPETLKLLPLGQVGLMELVTPFNAMMPTLAILATDWVSIHEDKCPCAHNSPTFTLHGRAGLSKHKGCALQADEIVKRGGKNHG